MEAATLGDSQLEFKPGNSDSPATPGDSLKVGGCRGLLLMRRRRARWVRARQPLDQSSMKRPPCPLGYPVLGWGHRLNEEVCQHVARQERIINRKVEISRVDINASDGECSTAVEPPMEIGPLNTINELFQSKVPMHWSQPSTLLDYFDYVSREVRKDTSDIAGGRDLAGK